MDANTAVDVIGVAVTVGKAQGGGGGGGVGGR